MGSTQDYQDNAIIAVSTLWRFDPFLRTFKVVLISVASSKSTQFSSYVLILNVSYCWS